MENNWEIVQNARESLRNFIKAYDPFRKGNSCLNDMLDNVESILDLDKFSKSACTQKNDIDCVSSRTKAFPIPSAALAPRPGVPTSLKSGLVPLGKKRKLCVNHDNDEDKVSPFQEMNKDKLNDSIKQREVDDDEQSAEDQVFAIQLVFELILSYLPASDLKTCRLLSNTWNYTATKILLDKQIFKIVFDFKKSTSDSNLYALRTNRRCYSEIHLSVFTSLLSKTIAHKRNFPCNNFAFRSSSITNAEIQNFLKKFGSIVKFLEIQMCDIEEDESDDDDEYDDKEYRDQNRFKLLHDFKKSLTQYLPNLEDLVVGNFPSFWGDTSDLGQLFPEPSCVLTSKLKLKSLCFSTPPPEKILNDLLLASPSLVNLKCNANSGDFLHSLVKTNKIHLVTICELKLDQYYFESHKTFILSKTNASKLRLKTLVICTEDENSEPIFNVQQVSQVITEFLNSNSQGLETLHTQPLANCVGLKIPVLPKLKKLKFIQLNNTHKRLFPEEVVLWDKFPMLEYLEISKASTISSHHDLEWENIFGAQDAIGEELQSLKYLHLDYGHYGPPAKWVEKCCIMFPNLISVRIGIVDDFIKACEVLWKLEKLEYLRIGVDFNMDCEQNAYPALDVAFTGFSNETCLQLYENSRNVDVSSLGAMRENPSILDAKNLRKLELSIIDSGVTFRGEDDGESGPPLVLPIMSHVTGLFAFKMCPKLHVALFHSGLNDCESHAFKRGLSPILPFVDELVPEKL